MKLSNVIASVLGTAFIAVGCMDQYDPSPEHKLFKEESTHANKPAPKLTKEGKIPVVKKAATKVAADPAAEKYQTFCASCHGADGKADSPAAKALNPKPRNFADKAWQGKVDDARIAKVIKEGGSAVGLSPTMAPWGAMLSDSEVNGMVKMIRDFAK
jgi:mono/diheme cytochrome c family protein